MDTDSNTATMYIDKHTDIPGSGALPDTFNVIGIASQYDYSSPYWEGYQIIPRCLADLGIVVGVEEKPAPIAFLSRNIPNPFNTRTTIEFAINRSGHTSLKIYNVTGQLVKTLVDSYMENGTYTRTWNGRDENGRMVTSGVYFYRLQSSDASRTNKMVIAR